MGPKLGFPGYGSTLSPLTNVKNCVLRGLTLTKPVPLSHTTLFNDPRSTIWKNIFWPSSSARVQTSVKQGLEKNK